MVKSARPDRLRPRAYSLTQIRAAARQDPRNALATEIVHASGIRAHDIVFLAVDNTVTRPPTYPAAPGELARVGVNARRVNDAVSPRLADDYRRLALLGRAARAGMLDPTQARFRGRWRMTCDDSPCGGPDIEGMRRFLARRDRDRPDVFAGRGDVIRDLSEAMRLAADTGGAPGATRVVQGAPGAGKTALLKETLERIAPSAGAAGADTPLVLEIDPDTFASRTAVVAAVEAAMGRREGAEVGEGVEGVEEVGEIAPTPHASETRRTAGASAFGVRGAAGRTRTRNYAGRDVPLPHAVRTAPRLARAHRAVGG